MLLYIKWEEITKSSLQTTQNTQKKQTYGYGYIWIWQKFIVSKGRVEFCCALYDVIT